MTNTNLSRSLIVPTDDAAVKRLLRELHYPMCYFGEGAAERRERLARIFSKLSPEARNKLRASESKPITSDEDDQDKIFYYEGNEALHRARYQIAEFSIRRCNDRLDMARIKQLEPISTRLISEQDLIERVRQLEDLGSYLDEEILATELKTLTSCSLNPSATLLATSCRSGRCKLLSMRDNNLETHLVLNHHQSNANFITFSPKSGNDLTPNSANLASCSMDGSVVMWNLIDKMPICKLSGPQSWRVTRVRYHPSSDYLASCCSDKSWRLWDIPTETEILHQEGHADGVFDLGFHPDGSLAGSASLDSNARIWDLRTGRSIQLLEGHTGGLRTIDFSPDGFHVATGSMDNSVKIWNLRQRKLEYTIPAHLKAVTTVMFDKDNGYFLSTASFDKTVKFWSTRTWAPIKTIEAYDDKVTNLDISSKNDKGHYLVTCHFKYVKLWQINNQAS